MLNKSLKTILLTTGVLFIGGAALWQFGFLDRYLKCGHHAADNNHCKHAEEKCSKDKRGTGAPMMPDHGGMMKEHGGMMGMMMMADKNKDGMISLAEHSAHADEMFKAMDANKDGMISADEMKAHHEAMSGAMMNAAPETK